MRHAYEGKKTIGTREREREREQFWNGNIVSVYMLGLSYILRFAKMALLSGL